MSVHYTPHTKIDPPQNQQSTSPPPPSQLTTARPHVHTAPHPSSPPYRNTHVAYRKKYRENRECRCSSKSNIHTTLSTYLPTELPSPISPLIETATKSIVKIQRPTELHFFENVVVKTTLQQPTPRGKRLPLKIYCSGQHKLNTDSHSISN